MATKISHSEAVECRWCQNIAPMRIIGCVSDIIASNYEDGQRVEHGTIYEVLACPKCDQVTLRSGRWHEMMEPEDWCGKVIYPNERQEIEGLPEDVEREFRAAEKVSGISANAYAVLLGRVLDVVCDDRKALGDTLYARLSDLAKRNEMPKNLAEIAQKLRQLRNVGAHADLGTLTGDEVPVLAALCKAVLEYVYSAPKLVARVESLLSKLKEKE